MIQDIGAGRFHNEYRDLIPKAEDTVLCCRGREVLAAYRDGMLSFLSYGELAAALPDRKVFCRYLFSIDDRRYFLADCGLAEELLAQGGLPQFAWRQLESLRGAQPKELSFAGVTGYQLAEWYAGRKFCPRCGKAMVHDKRERMMRCEACGQMEYPKISPAVIVGVTDGDRILLTRYAGRGYRKYALIAGFAEIGETIEETVQREVMEEVGLKVKNIRYYKSQPWSFSSTLLMGFFAEVDGVSAIRLDETELSEARWCTRDEIPEDDGVSLTREMMRIFREGQQPL